MTDKRFTVTGTDIEEVKKQNSESGLTYNQVKQLLKQQYAQARATSILSPHPEKLR